MDRNKQLEVIRSACIKANPETKQRGLYTDMKRSVVISLADVLLAIEQNKERTLVVDTAGQFFEAFESDDDGTGGYPSWNLRQDGLTLQSDETINFLSDLLQ